MPDWNEVINEISEMGTPHDVVRRKYLKKMSEHTGRNTIIYYSGWLQKENLASTHASPFSVNDNDKNGFMSAISGLDKNKGLDLLLHTPGGDIAATESLVDYLKQIFGRDIRAIIPQLAMSAGTMIACSTSEIIMGKHSSLGPIDPQIGGRPAHGILEEFQKAADDIAKDKKFVSVWQPIIAKYPPTIIGQCQKAIDWSEEMVKQWLEENMFIERDNPSLQSDDVVSFLGSNALTKSHSRHISIDRALELGLNVTYLEDDKELQDFVLSVHHAATCTLDQTKAIKIIENSNGTTFLQHVN